MDFYSDDAKQVLKANRAIINSRGIEAEFVSLVGPAADAGAKQGHGGSFGMPPMGPRGNCNQTTYNSWHRHGSAPPVAGAP